MKDFKDCLEGYFDNKYQAMKDPSRYAHIKISHIRLGEDIFYGEQAYSHQIRQPYRQFVLKISRQKNEYIVQNYSIDKPERFVNHKNLEILSEEPLRRRLGCDIIFRENNGLYKGKTCSNDCTVNYKGRETYLLNDIELGDDSYWVLDKGFDSETDEQVWGAKWGYLKFYRVLM